MGYTSDLVESENPKTGERDHKRVVQIFVNETLELVHLFIGSEEIVTTPTHPFWVINAEWCSAIEIRAGDVLKRSDDTTITVDAVAYEILDSPVRVYNFEVEDYHTYYVGCGVLVHNSCKIPDNHTPEGAGRRGAFNQAKRDYGIPTSQQPTRIGPNLDKHNNVIPGRAYYFSGGKIIRDDCLGHVYDDGGHLGPHFNGINGTHYFY